MPAIDVVTQAVVTAQMKWSYEKKTLVEPTQDVPGGWKNALLRFIQGFTHQTLGAQGQSLGKINMIRQLVDQDLAASASVDVDFDPAADDFFGDAPQSIQYVKGVLIINRGKAVDPTLLSTLAVKPRATDGWQSWITVATTSILIPAGGMFMMVADEGYDTDGSTKNQITITNQSSTEAARWSLCMLGID